jgi:hypothetical protein
MTPEERDIIVNFIARVSGAQAPGASFGSVPTTVPAPALPPVDREADALIGEQFARYPEARYRLTQLAFVQEHALAEAQNRIKRLEWEVQQAQQQAQQAAQQAAAQPQQSRGFLGGLFGGGSSQPQPPQGVWGQGGPAPNQPPPNWQQQAPPPPPQYAPGYQQGMFQRPGSGFLGSALTTAAGVAGGLVVGNALMDMFSPHREGGGMFGGGGPMEGAGASPWGGSALPEPPVPPAPGYVDQGSWTTPDPSAPTADNAWAQPQPQPDDSSWSDTGGGGSDWASGDTSGGGGSDDDSFV